MAFLLAQTYFHCRINPKLYIMTGNCMIMDGRWFDFYLMYKGLLFGFFKGNIFHSIGSEKHLKT